MLTLLAQLDDFSGFDSSTSGIPELTTSTADAGSIAALMAWILPMMGILSIIGLALYIYMALALYAVAKKTNTPNAWMAWVPIANIVLTWQVSKTPVWALIVVLCLVLGAIPILGTIIAMASAAAMIFMWWKICERLGYPTWWSIMQLIFPVWIVMVGIIAWGKKGSTTTTA